MAYTPMQANDDMTDSSYVVPNVNINRFVLSRLEMGSVRIGLGEARALESPIYWRGAVVLSPYQAWELSKLIQSVLGDDYATFEKSQGE